MAQTTQTQKEERKEFVDDLKADIAMALHNIFFDAGRAAQQHGIDDARLLKIARAAAKQALHEL